MSERAQQLRGATVAAVAAAQEAGREEERTRREEERARRALERAERESRAAIERVEALLLELAPAAGACAPLAMILHCPRCHAQHVDDGEFTTTPHHAHLCAGCGETWQPCARPTVGVREIES